MAVDEENDVLSDMDKGSTDILLNDTKSTFSIDLTASYGSINSEHFENNRPEVKPGSSSYESGSGNNRITKRLKRIFTGRVDSLVEPRFEDDHLISCPEDKTNCQLIAFSLKHSLTIFLVTLPTIFVSCAFVIGYSYIPWTNVKCDLNETNPCPHYKKEYLVYFNTYTRMVRNIHPHTTHKCIFCKNVLFDKPRIGEVNTSWFHFQRFSI